MISNVHKCEVLIVGAGPCGLMLALELGRRGIGVYLIDVKPGIALHPQANATQARTMEHFRRLGFAHEVRRQGLPPDHPTDIAYFTRFNAHELARLRLPTARQATQAIQSMKGSWSAAELPHRVSQKFVETTLLDQVRQHPSVQVFFAHRMTSFEDQGHQVVAEVHDEVNGHKASITARFLMGADGARSGVRHHLGIDWTGQTGIKREFMGGKMLAIYFYSPEFYERLTHDPAWMYVSVNSQRRVFMATVDGLGEFALHAAIHQDEENLEWSNADAQRIVAEAMGETLPMTVKSVGTWLAGHSLCAESFGYGRVFIGGDAAHLFTPTGGLGYNTAVEDAINLGWKLAHVLRGLAPESLLGSYGLERQPIAQRNTSYARHFADSVGLFQASPELEIDGDTGDAERARASEHFNAHVRMEFNIPGVTFGCRYDGSPIVVSDGTQPPPDAANVYVPSACPGGRPPHAWWGKNDSLFDHFGHEWTLLLLGEQPANPDALVQEAHARGLDLTVLPWTTNEGLALYKAPLVLIRPDHIVGWRGQSAHEAASIWDQLLGMSEQGNR